MKQHRSLILVIAIVALLIALWSGLALVTPKPVTLDQHVHSIASQLKCPVCQNESVADSSADLAQQMRQSIRQQLQAGKSDQAIVQFFAARYGNDIVLSPPWQGLSLFAWLVPIGLLLAGAVLIFSTLREWQRGAPDLAVSGSASEQRSAEEVELDQYRAQLEQELAADDVIFHRRTTEAR